MAEKRKPHATMLLKFKGKTNKMEMFNMRQWEPHNHMGNKYRIRINGAWFPKGKKVFFTKTEIKEMYFRGI